MGSRNVSIRADTYEKLRGRKREDESFTDVIERLLDDERDFEAGFGAWAGTDAGEVARQTRQDLDESIAGRTEDGREDG